MGFGAIRSIIRPISRIILPASNLSPVARTFSATSPELRRLFAPVRRNVSWIPPCGAFHSLTDTRYPKRRPVDKPRRKRASMKPRGPYAWVKYVPGELVVPNQPNEGSVKKRNEKKRIKLHRAFIKIYDSLHLEATPNYFRIVPSRERVSLKRKLQKQEAKKKKLMKRVERKMAAVARERAWAERLVELKRIEEEKKEASMA